MPNRMLEGTPGNSLRNKKCKSSSSSSSSTSSKSSTSTDGKRRKKEVVKKKGKKTERANVATEAGTPALLTAFVASMHMAETIEQMNQDFR